MKTKKSLKCLQYQLIVLLKRAAQTNLCEGKNGI